MLDKPVGCAEFRGRRWKAGKYPSCAQERHNVVEWNVLCDSRKAGHRPYDFLKDDNYGGSSSRADTAGEPKGSEGCTMAPIPSDLDRLVQADCLV